MKKKKIRSVFSFVMIACLMLAFAPRVHAANASFPVDGIYYEIISEDDKTVQMVSPPSGGNSYSGNITIPEKITYNGSEYTVTAIGAEAFGESEEVTDIVIPSTVTSIGINAFGGCTALKSLVIPASVTNELGGAMTGLWGRDFRISFKHPDWMKINVTFGEGSPYSIEGGVLYNGNVAEAALDYDATTITIREGTTEIADVAFNFPYAPGTDYYNQIDRRKTETVVLPSSVKIIGEMAFKYCPLKSINLTSVETIEAGAFIGTYITKADLTQTKTIGYQAFSGCTNLSDVTWPTNLEKFELGDPTGVGADSTASRAFEKCTSLKSVVLTGPLTDIPKGTFQNCRNIEFVVIPESVTEIGMNAFSNGFSSGGATIIMRSATPPMFGKNAFNTTADLIVIVPTDSENAYAATDALKGHMTDGNGDVIQNEDYSVNIDKDEAAICLDSEQEYSFSVTKEVPTDAILKVTSSDETIVTVEEKENGFYKINGVSAGKATLKATITLNDIVLVEDTCTVTVSNHTTGTDWTADDSNHWHLCNVCGEKTDENAHIFKWIVDKEATKTEAGWKHEECEVCKYKKAGVEIPATGTTDPEKPDNNNPSDTDEKPNTSDDTDKKPNTSGDKDKRPNTSGDTDKKANTSSDTDKKANTLGNSEKHPETGDGANMQLWSSLLLLSGGLVAAIIGTKRKRKLEKQPVSILNK